MVLYGIKILQPWVKEYKIWHQLLVCLFSPTWVFLTNFIANTLSKFILGSTSYLQMVKFLQEISQSLCFTNCTRLCFVFSFITLWCHCFFFFFFSNQCKGCCAHKDYFVLFLLSWSQPWSISNNQTILLYDCKCKTCCNLRYYTLMYLIILFAIIQWDLKVFPYTYRAAQLFEQYQPQWW